MESALTIWNRRRDEPWLAGIDPAAFAERVAQRRKALAPGCRVLNVEADAIDFLAGFVAAVTAEEPVAIFLGSARWSEAERKHCLDLVRPHVVWGCGISADATSAADVAPDPRRLIMIPSGGTTGGLRFAAHTWESLNTAAHGLQRWLGGGPINSVCFLPLHHVSGLMQAVRSFVTGGMLVLAEWPAIADGEFPAMAATAVTSLVPTQLERLRSVRGAADWLRGFRVVFLGGARAPDNLLAWARDEKLPLAAGYGMTETAAQVATMGAEDFLRGQPIAARPLPHAEITIVDESGAPRPRGQVGRIAVKSAALFCGYHPEPGVQPEIFATGDRGVLDDDGRLVVLGRLDTIINTGAEKVDPEEVEAALVATGLIRTAAVVGIPDEKWGEVVAAAVVTDAPLDESLLVEKLRSTLAPHKIPRQWLFVPALPRNAAGKVDLAALREQLRGNMRGAG